jgi:hypothetical protein
MAKSKPIEVDILDMEMSKDLPHWLDPIVKYSGTHDAARRASQMERSNMIQAEQQNKRAEQKAARLKSQWARTKARSQALLAKGDFIRDPVTGEFQGSHPGPGHGEGEGSDKPSGVPRLQGGRQRARHGRGQRASR